MSPNPRAAPEDWVQAIRPAMRENNLALIASRVAGGASGFRLRRKHPRAQREWAPKTNARTDMHKNTYKMAQTLLVLRRVRASRRFLFL